MRSNVTRHLCVLGTVWTFHPRLSKAQGFGIALYYKKDSKDPTSVVPNLLCVHSCTLLLQPLLCVSPCVCMCVCMGYAHKCEKVCVCTRGQRKLLAISSPTACLIPLRRGLSVYCNSDCFSKTENQKVPVNLVSAPINSEVPDNHRTMFILKHGCWDSNSGPRV